MRLGSGVHRTCLSNRFRCSAAAATLVATLLITGTAPTTRADTILPGVGAIDLAAFWVDPIGAMQSYAATTGVIDPLQVRTARVGGNDYTEGTTLLRVTRHFHGIPVIGSVFHMWVVDSTGEVTEIRMRWPYLDPALSVEATLAAEGAQEIAEDAFLHVYDFEDAESDPALRIAYSENDPSAHLVWRFVVYGVLDTTRYDPYEEALGFLPLPPDVPDSYYFHIDAHTGHVLWRSFNQITSAEPTAVAPQRADAPFLSASPNPFNPRTTLRFNVAEAGAVRLDVYDVGGRRVRTLVDAPREAGTHAVTWNGRDASGRNAASGVYIARLTVTGESQATSNDVKVQRLTLVR